METLQEYQAGILERVKNFPRGGIPEWVEAQVLLHEVDALARYGYPIEGMSASDYAALVAAVTPPWHAAKTPVEAAQIMTANIGVIAGGSMSPREISRMRSVLIPESEVIFRLMPDGFSKVRFAANLVAVLEAVDKVLKESL
jgi:hypothetical protein|nr:MAG TPA: hypothetical protein [Caudoviricetes sp.]